MKAHTICCYCIYSKCTTKRSIVGSLHADIKRATCDMGVFSREIRIVFQISTVQSDYKLRGLRCIPVPGAPTQLSSMWSRNVTQMAVWCVWCCEANERKPTPAWAASGMTLELQPINGHYSLQPNLIGENNVIPNDCMSIHLALIIQCTFNSS